MQAKCELALRFLLDHLVQERVESTEVWRDWHVMSIQGGWNGRVYRATSPLGDYAVKFTARDERRRAEREYQALLTLAEAGLAIAPLPVLLDCSNYALPVVVQTWLTGDVSADVPASDDDWEGLLRHLALVHSVTSPQARLALPPAVTTAVSPAGCLRLVDEQARRIPAEALPAEAKELLRRFYATHLPDWSRAEPVLCRCDANILNFVRRPYTWASVDWENSGWGDPAFEIAELTMHPAYLDVGMERWNWVVETYARIAGDPAITARIYIYRQVVAVWWVFRMLRYLREIPLGLDPRLAGSAPAWLAVLPARYAHYLALAQQLQASS